MLAAIALTLVGVAFQPVNAQTTAQPAQVFVRDSSAPAQTDPRAGGMHDAGLRPPADTDSPNAQLTNAHGDALNVSIAGWRSASGQADFQPLMQGGGVRVRASFKGLIANGRYSLFLRQLAGRVGVVLTPVDIVGASNSFLADRDGNGIIAVDAPNPIPSGAQLVLIYHSDGAEHQSSPGNLGITAHEQLITRVP
ncbi:MAG TPA: hypothetical protein VHS78_19825 [Candidatus Elarobacter sp.]|jgi:hypothetical protein|nr:hypothetical protein [Candidatus Elarobacter sp.]